MQAVVRPALQEPAPEQEPALVAWVRFVEQAGEEHTFPAAACAQVNDAESQAPVLPHPALEVSAGQLEPQQILAPVLVDTQAPLAQSASAAQVLPFALRQFPPEQTYPLAPSQVVAAFALVQEVAQAVPEQRYPGLQAVVTIAGQAPPPPGQLAGAIIEELEAQAAARQTVLLEYFWQAPLPSQTPVFPQVVAAAAVHAAPSVEAWGSAALAATGVHVPGLVPLQVKQAMLVQLEVAQQTESRHAPELHWLLAVQAPPLASFWQIPLEQV